MLYVAQKDITIDHEHLLYISEQGAAECAEANGHIHPVSVDMTTGQIILAPIKNHTHATAPYRPEDYMPLEELAPDLTRETEADTIARKADQFQLAWMAEQDSIERGRESVKFREGDQWPDSVRKALEAKSRTCLTINHVAPMVETLSGMYRRNRSDLKVFPTESGDADIADILTYVLKNISVNSAMDLEEIEAFEDMIVPGRGVLELYPDFDVDIRGSLKLRHVPWDMIVFGPHQRKDLEDCEYFCRWKWLSQDMLKNLFPEKAEEISLMFGRFEQFIAGADDLSDLGTPLTSALFADTKTREIRLIECEEKMYYRVSVYINPANGETISEAELPKMFRSQIKDFMSLRSVARRLYKIRRTIMCGDVLIEDKYIDRPIPPNAAGPSFSVFPCYAYKRGARFEGKVERIKDPQREINKRRSQIVDIVNTSINNGWLVPKGAFGSQHERNKFKNTVSTPGFIIDVPDMTNVPVKIESSRVEPALVQLELNSLQSFRETSNVNVEMLGQGGQYQSGSAMAHRMQQGLMGNEYLFDNMSQVKKRIGREILLWVQELYDAERIARIFFDQAKIEKIYVGSREVDPNDVALLQQIQQRLKDADLTQYDVTIGETGQSPTAQLANFDMMMELAGKGVPLPPQLFIELAPIPNKARIYQILEQASQQQAEAEDKKYNTEIQKTLIAAQSKGRA